MLPGQRAWVGRSGVGRRRGLIGGYCAPVAEMVRVADSARTLATEGSDITTITLTGLSSCRLARREAFAAGGLPSTSRKRATPLCACAACTTPAATMASRQSLVVEESGVNKRGGPRASQD